MVLVQLLFNSIPRGFPWFSQATGVSSIVQLRKYEHLEFLKRSIRLPPLNQDRHAHAAPGHPEMGVDYKWGIRGILNGL
jgi:hypothetical protein